METSARDLPWQSVYKIMIGSIVPRPIGWVSTVDEQGRANLAPFSFFNAVCGNPPTVLFCPDIRSTDRASKDTLRNARSNGEFVLNIVTLALAENMNQTSAELPAEIDEFVFAGLEKSASVAVKPPRVAKSPVHFECIVKQIIEIGDQPGAGSIVIGEIIHLHVDPSVLFDSDKIDPFKLKAIGRLGGATYCRTSDLFQMQRPPSQIPKA
jgi:flavin reductase (DIM6/NTAB) family NADH-FMN oxidoreductase RutF